MQFSAVLAILAMTSSVFAVPTQTGPKASQENTTPAHLAQFKAETLAKPAALTSIITAEDEDGLPDFLAFKAEVAAKLAELKTKETKRSPDGDLFKRSCSGCMWSQVFSDYGSINRICCYPGGPCYGNQCACGIC
ncbi:hypothetical protein TI39_contig296g00013 [Zymoseptoria brevis]|uniref:Invertebrate defensins family profile domain-containing protein n=1 Tax=Zymoseptoria brevis TaxID=1047168 RepID=A0A0F4GV69_9PEZI|nr:hypothetical protein TI39_contig296g00013 [Zymoseptoria brevis]